jgi:hypothetical protein
MQEHAEARRSAQRTGTDGDDRNLAASRMEVEQAAYAALRHDFHVPSRTHIVWCPSVGRGATKGFGDAPDEAHRSFANRLAALLEAAGPSDLERWLADLIHDQADRQREARVKALAANERLGEYSISLDPAQMVALKPAPDSGSMNDRIVTALRKGLEQFRVASRKTSEAGLREAVAGNEATLRAGRRDRGNDLEVRTVRMDAELHARLRLSSHETGVKMPELCRYIVSLALDLAVDHFATDSDTNAASGSNLPFDGKRSDPLADLDGPAFRKVAADSGIPRVLLAAIRNREVEVPLPVARRIARTLPVVVPEEVILAAYVGTPRVSATAMYKAGGKPSAVEGKTPFQEAAASAGLTEEAINRLLAE